MGCASFYMTAGGEVSGRRICVSQRRPLQIGSALLCGIATGDAVALAMTAGGGGDLEERLLGRQIRVSQRRPLRMRSALLCGIATGDAVALAMTVGGGDRD